MIGLAHAMASAAFLCAGIFSLGYLAHAAWDERHRILAALRGKPIPPR